MWPFDFAPFGRYAQGLAEIILPERKEVESKAYLCDVGYYRIIAGLSIIKNRPTHTGRFLEFWVLG